MCARTSNLKTAVIGLIIVAAFGRLANADVPGFKQIQITATPKDRDSRVRINDRGDIVYSSRINMQESGEEIFLYTAGTAQRLTNDKYRDAFPDINNSGVVVWSRAIGEVGRYGPTFEVARWQSGQLDLLTNDDRDDKSPKIDQAGDIYWEVTTGWGCRDATIDGVRRYSNGVITEVYDDGRSNQVSRVAGTGLVVWTRYDFCPQQWESEIMLYDNGEIVTLGGGYEPQTPSIAPNRLVAWSDGDDLQLWNDGQVTHITDAGRTPVVNSRGDISFIRWDDENRVWQSWLYLGGEFRMIAGDAMWNLAEDMNERGDIVVRTGKPGADYDVYLYQRLPDGDMNCDEKVDFDDIDGFVEAITDRATYQKNNKTCDWWLADCNGDRKIDFNDIDAFIDCLINNGCP